MPFADYAKYDALGLAKLVRDKKIRPIELVDAAIERIERHNPTLNAVVWTAFDRARAMAKKRLPDGPFAGVPFLLKDILGFWEGAPTRSGARFMADIPFAHSAELTNRYLRAGLVPIGKTNVPEYGLLPITEPTLYGPARNPWNIEHSTGGSSGGSAAAVAAGIVPIAHANDGGGSIRIPAACCGLVGLKPSRARNPLGPDFGDLMSGLIAEHIVSRTVRDTAAMLDATAGPALGDPYAAPPAPKSYLSAMKKDPGRLRIAVATKRLDGEAFHPDCVAAVQHAAKLCRDLGHKVEEASPQFDYATMLERFMMLWSSGLAAQIDGIAMMTGQKVSEKAMEGLTFGLYQEGRKVTGAQYLAAVAAMQGVARAVAAFHQKYDCWLTTTLARPPLKLGSIDLTNSDPKTALATVLDYVPFTAVQNATGQPAINLPLHWNDAGLPIGVQFVGRVGDEETLLKLAFQLEKAEPWNRKHPPVWD
ncbi:MAG: amidase [Alphaproteobacteria bacterium]|nr:amidase [Alphaproteobacteria bacterium]